MGCERRVETRTNGANAVGSVGLDYLLKNYNYEGCPAEGLIIQKINAGLADNKQLMELIFDNSLHKEKGRKAALKKLIDNLPKLSPREAEAITGKCMNNYNWTKSPAEEIIIAAIRAGKLSMATLLAISFDRANHRAAARDAAVAQIQKELPKHSPQEVELIVKESLKEYFTYGVPAEKIIIAAVGSGKLSESTLFNPARDHTLHHEPVYKAARKKLEI